MDRHSIQPEEATMTWVLLTDGAEFQSHEVDLLDSLVAVAEDSHAGTVTAAGQDEEDRVLNFASIARDPDSGGWMGCILRPDGNVIWAAS